VTDHKKMQGGSLFNPLLVDWMEADMNASLQLIVKKKGGV